MDWIGDTLGVVIGHGWAKVRPSVVGRPTLAARGADGYLRAVVRQLQPGSTSAPIWQRVLTTFALAMVGAAAGYFYASTKLSPEMMKSSSLPAMYASTGAVSVVLFVRMYSILKALFFDRS